ncbi:MAG TPA: geranylgeranyl reductase family protein [Nocardioidaceae bacterium]|nr:geranylgeranyl reductase family protein [Nocardioidaceae bacterium]
MSVRWDLVVVGAGPAGSAAALGALHAQPDLSVLLLDRADFPRDKACGDGVAPQVLDVLAGVGVQGLLDDRVPVGRLRLRSAGAAVSRTMARPAYVVPRTVLDARLRDAAVTAGATVRRQRVRMVDAEPGQVRVDDLRAAVVVGADGAHSEVARRLSAGGARRPVPGTRTALAIRGYAPVRAVDAGTQTIVFGPAVQPSYAWSFDRGDGLANVGYGELLRAGRPAPGRAQLIEQVERLLPGATVRGTDWRGHHLPLSSWGWTQPVGRCLLAGDAAHLVNPMTGEGIYYAVTTGVLAGRAAAASLRADGGRSAGRRYARAVSRALSGHLRHTSLAARLVSLPRVARAGIRAAADDQRVFDALVDLGLAQGRITPRVAGSLVRALTADGRVPERAC